MTVKLSSSEQTKASSIVDWLMKNCGFTLAGASGVAGNMKCESSFNSAAYNGNDVGKASGGLCQWRDTRLRNLQAFAKSKGKPWTDMETQLAFLYNELTTIKTYKTLLGVLKSTNNPAQASYSWGHDFEVFAGYNNANGSEHQKRAAFSKYIFNGKKTGNWKSQDLQSLSSEGDIQADMLHMSASTYTIDAGPNKVFKLASAKRKYDKIPSLSEDRKNEFSALQTSMLNNTPEMGRTILLTEEMYDANILKGNQESKKEKVK